MNDNTQLPDMSHYDDCRDLMESHKKRHIARLAFAFVFGLINGVIHIMPAAASGGAGFFIALLSMLFYLLILVLAVQASVEKLKPLLIILVVLAVGMVLGLVSFGIGFALLVIYATQLPEHKRSLWLKEQAGYPHFDRFVTMQEYGTNEYHSRYDITEQDEDAEMPAVGTEFDPDNTPKETAAMPSLEGIAELKAPPKRNMPARSPAAVPEAFAGIAPMAHPAPVVSAAAEPLPEPEVPKVDFSVPTEIPDPVWDVPDPVMDTSSVVSNFPEINGDIADLPDIPDIPVI